MKRFVVDKPDEGGFGKLSEGRRVADLINISPRRIKLRRVVLDLPPYKIGVCRASVADSDVGFAATKVADGIRREFSTQTRTSEPSACEPKRFGSKFFSE